MGEKGSLRNRIKEWLVYRKQKQIKKEQEQQEILKKRKKTKKEQKNKELIVTQSFRSFIQLSLKSVFGYLLSIVEHVSINTLRSKEKNIDKKQQNAQEDMVGVKDKQTTNLRRAHIKTYKGVDKNTSILNMKKETPKVGKKEVNTILNAEEKREFIEGYVEESIPISLEEITSHITTLKQDFHKALTEEKELEKKRKKIISIKEEIQTVKKQYLTFAEETQLSKFEHLQELETIDLYNLRYSPKKIKAMIAACDKELSKIKQQKQDVHNNSFQDNKQKQIDSVKSNMNQLKTVIEENLIEQQLDIHHIRTLFNKVEVQKKRGTIVTGIHNFLSKTLNIGLGLIPLKLCKNKWFGILGSTIIINNRLRGMRRMMRKENQNINYITYKNVMNSIQNEKSCIQKANEILLDTCTQLENLKQEFIMEFYYDMDRYPEVEDIMAEFSSISYELTSKGLELEKNLGEISDALEQTKQKVKIME